MQLEWYVERKAVKAPSEALGRDLTPVRDGLSGLPIEEGPAKEDVQRVLELSTMSNSSTLTRSSQYRELSFFASLIIFQRKPSIWIYVLNLFRNLFLIM
jgi:hypothetical protein